MIKRKSLTVTQRATVLKESFPQLDASLDPEAGIELRQLLRPLLKWWWALLLVPLLCSATAYYTMQSSPRYYQARTVLQFGLPLSQASSQLPLPPIPLLGPTYKEMVVSDQFLKVVAAQPGINLTVPELQEAIISFHTYWTSTIEIQATSTSPTQTLSILNTVNAVLFTQTPELTQLQLDFINQREDELIKQNEALQQQLDSLSRQLEAPPKDATTTVSAVTVDDLRNQISTNNVELKSLNYYLTTVETYQLHADVVPTLVNSTLGPKPFDAAVAMGLVGLALVVVLVYLLEKLSNSMYSVQELEHLIGQQAALVLESNPYKGLPYHSAQAWDLLASEIAATYFNSKASILLTVLYDQSGNNQRDGSNGNIEKQPAEIAALADALSRLGIKTIITNLKSFGTGSSVFNEKGSTQNEALYEDEGERMLECELVGLAWPTAPHILRHLSSRSEGLIVLLDLNSSNKNSLTQLARSLKAYTNLRNVKTVVQV